MAPLAFTFPNAVLSFLLFGAGAAGTDIKPTCAYVEIARTVPGALERVTEWRAPGHCETVIGHNGPAKSRRFNCYSGCGGTKLQYQEFEDEMCQEPIVDKMLHRKPKGGDSAWQTGPQPDETFLMDFDLGSVRDFDCSLAFCFVMESVEHPVDSHAQKVRHIPADRQMCTRTKTGYQWTQCRPDGNLELFESDVCHETSEPSVLDIQADNGSKSIAGVVREWECEGFDAVDDDEDIPEQVLRKAQRAQRTALARREMAVSTKAASKAKPEDTGTDLSTVLIFLAIGSFPLIAFGLLYCRKSNRSLKDMLPMPMSKTSRYAGLSQQDDLLV